MEEEGDVIEIDVTALNIVGIAGRKRPRKRLTGFGFRRMDLEGEEK